MARWLFALVLLSANLVALPASAQTPSPGGRPAPPGMFSFGEERIQPRACPDQWPGAVDDTLGCWAPETYTPRGDGSWLAMNVQPAFARIYVNGKYAGTVQQYTHPFRALRLGLGPQRIELRAPGYKTSSFWWRQERETINTLNGTLEKK